MHVYNCKQLFSSWCAGGYYDEPRPGRRCRASRPGRGHRFAANDHPLGRRCPATLRHAHLVLRVLVSAQAIAGRPATARARVVLVPRGVARAPVPPAADRPGRRGPPAAPASGAVPRASDPAARPVRAEALGAIPWTGPRRLAPGAGEVRRQTPKETAPRPRFPPHQRVGPAGPSPPASPSRSGAADVRAGRAAPARPGRAVRVAGRRPGLAPGRRCLGSCCCLVQSWRSPLRRCR